MFNNEVFDGVSIEIPSSVILLNPEIKEVLISLAEKLDKIKFMRNHPRIDRSIYEIENYKEKGERERERKKQAEIRLDDERKKINSYVDKSVIPVSNKDVLSMVVYTDSVIFNDKTFNDILTKRGSLKMEIVNYFNEKKKNWSREDFFNFLYENRIHIERNQIIENNFNLSEVSLRIDSYLNLGVRFKSNTVKMYFRNDKKIGEVFYYELFLFKDDKGFYCSGRNIEGFNIENGKIYLNEYDFKGDKFVKKN